MQKMQYLCSRIYNIYTNMRILFDKILRTGIKACMLTGVAFTMAACYGPMPAPEDPEQQENQEQVEQQLSQAAKALE